MKVDGTCHCGAVAYEAEADPLRCGLCHCTDCQVFSSSAFRFFVVATRDSFRLLRGEPKSYEKKADSGERRQHHFCPVCATRIYTGGENAPTINLSVSCLRQRTEFRPRVQVFTRSSCAWLDDLKTITSFDALPGAQA